MLKKTFLKKLELSLTPLGEEKVSKIIKKYDKLIDEEVKKGKLEKDVVSSFGDIDLISKLYLDDKDSPKKEETFSSYIDNFLDGIINFIDDTFEKVDKDLAKRILLILCFIFIGFMTVVLMQIPFRIINYTGRNILTYFLNNFYFYKIVGSLWSFGLGICFFIFIIWLIVKYTNKVVNHYTDINSNNSSDVKKEVVKGKKTTEIREYTGIEVLDVIFIVLKVFAVILTIPLIMIEIGLIISFVVSILLILNGIILYGPAIIIFGLIVFVSSILGLIYEVAFKGGIK